MSYANIEIISKSDHCSQIITGFLMLAAESDLHITITDRRNDCPYEHSNMAVVLVDYNGIKIAYDVNDGYQDIDGMRYWLSNCDVYFKRSFSSEYNLKYFKDFAHCIRPLGLNYYVTCKGNPYEESFIMRWIKTICGRTPKAFFTNDVFEATPHCKERDIQILFLTRLWEGNDSINETRIKIIERLREEYGNSFVGGISESKLAMKTAPHLVVSRSITEKKNYLRLLKNSDICVATTGLHESIGWKTAEYVAAGKAIVSEKLHYSVPGPFLPGINYLEFNDVEECLCSIDELYQNPMKTNEMKMNNMAYYYQFLRPDSFIMRSLSEAEK